MDVNSCPRYPTGRGESPDRGPYPERHGWAFAGGVFVAVALIALFLWLAFLAILLLFGPPTFVSG
jgi:hypothetical protein